MYRVSEQLFSPSSGEKMDPSPQVEDRTAVYFFCSGTYPLSFTTT
jgi:hypothetical protein